MMLSTEMILFSLLFVTIVLGGYPASSYYPQVKKYPYLPAPPGETPRCAKSGATYCEKIDTYPTEVISYLLYKWGRTYQPFIRSESDRDFFLISKTYGPAPYDSYKPQVTGGYSGQPLSSSSYLPDNNNNNNYQQQQQGYTNGQVVNASNSNNQDYVASYYRNPNSYGGGGNGNNNRYQREHSNGNTNGNNLGNSGPSEAQQGGYGYSFSIPSTSNPQKDGGENHLMAAAVPPILHSIWWNHRDVANNQPAYPQLNQHNQQSWEQRWRRRAKRQAGSSENQLCPIVSNYITPQAAMNNEGNWMYVVNMDNNAEYLQRVKSEVCAQGDGSPCNGLCSIPPGFSATCRQKYVQKRLVALDGSGERLMNDVFWFAHCCSCEVNQR